MSANAFQFELVSPEELVVSTKASQVVVPGEEGDFAFMASHTPVMSSLRAGLVTMFGESSSDETHFFIKGGLAEGGAKGLTILAEYAKDVASMDKDQKDDVLKLAEDQLKSAANDHEAKQAADMIEVLSAIS